MRKQIIQLGITMSYIWFYSIGMIFCRLANANSHLFWGLWATCDLVTLLTLAWDSLAFAPEALRKTRSTGVARSRWTHVACSTASVLPALILAIGFIFFVDHFSNMAGSYFRIWTSRFLTTIVPIFAVGQHDVAIVTLGRGALTSTPEAVGEAVSLKNIYFISIF